MDLLYYPKQWVNEWLYNATNGKLGSKPEEDKSAQNTQTDAATTVANNTNSSDSRDTETNKPDTQSHLENQLGEFSPPDVTNAVAMNEAAQGQNRIG